MRGRKVVAAAALAAVLLILPAVPAGAAVLESATGAVVYTPPDLEAAAAGDPYVSWLINHSHDGEGVLPETVPEVVEELLQGVRGLGVPDGVFRGLKVYVLPVASLPITTKTYNNWVVAGTTFDGTVVVAGLYWNACHVLLHELGHCVAEKALGASADFGRGLSGEKGREYLSLRGYPLECLDAGSQEGLMWSDRASEWFAEDFAYWAASRLGRAEWLKVYTAACGPPDERVLAWFDVLFMRMKTKDAWEEVRAK